MEMTCQLESSQCERSRLLLCFLRAAWASEYQRMLRVRLLVLPHRSPRRRRGVTGTITQTERHIASAGSWARCLNRRNAQLRTLHRQRCRPHMLARPERPRLRRPQRLGRQAPAATDCPPCRRAMRNRRPAVRRCTNLSCNAFSKETQRHPRRGQPLRKQARHSGAALKRPQRRPPPLSYGPTLPRSDRRRHISPLWFRATPVRAPSHRQWTLKCPALQTALRAAA
jgi:hypothetical protein